LANNHICVYFQVSKAQPGKTPRSFSAIANQIMGGAYSLQQTPSSKGKGAAKTRRTSKNRNSAGSSISEDTRPLFEDYNTKVCIYNCLGTQPFNANLAKKYFVNRRTMPANCYSNLGMAYNEARKKTVRIKQQNGVCGGGRVTAAAAATDAYMAEKDEILKTWEMLAFTVRLYEYRKKSLTSTCLDCRKKFMNCRCPWTETIKGHLLKYPGKNCDEEEFFPWGQKALGREVIEQRLEYHLGRGDIQTVATILCILDRKPKPNRISSRFLVTPVVRAVTRVRSAASITLSSSANTANSSNRSRSSNSESETLAAAAAAYGCGALHDAARPLQPNYPDTGRDVAMEAIESASASASTSNSRNSIFSKRRNFSLNVCSSEREGVVLGSSSTVSAHQRFHRFFSEGQTVAPAAASSFSTGHSFSHSNSGIEVENVEEVDEEAAAEEEDEEDASASTLLDPAKAERNEQIKRWYSQFLRDLGMEMKSLEMAKFLKYYPDEQAHRVDVSSACDGCSGSATENVDISNCANCAKSRPRMCVVCRLPVRGLVSVCLHCGHGGHVGHLREWFLTREQCPAACGCPCLEKMKGQAAG
jgi:hypothetical protein